MPNTTEYHLDDDLVIPECVLNTLPDPSDMSHFGTEDEFFPPSLGSNTMQDLPDMSGYYHDPSSVSLDPSSQSDTNSPVQCAGASGYSPPNNVGFDFEPNPISSMDGFENLETVFSQQDLNDLLNVCDTQLSMVPSNQSVAYGQYPEPTYDEPLIVIAEPKAYFRERYASEIDPDKNRAHRFIRTEDNNKKYEYPTVQIPQKYCDFSRSMFIRVTLVTVTNEKVPDFCVHPHPIDTPEKDVIKDIQRNSLYFRINEEEMRTGEKSFRITRTKIDQKTLRNYGSMRLFDSNDFDEQRVRNPRDAKQLIATYELWKSHLVFTLAERLPQQMLPTTMPLTKVFSRVTIDEESDKRKPGLKPLDCSYLSNIKCVPRRSAWAGGDEVVIIFSQPIKHRNYEITMKFSPSDSVTIEEQTQIDTKTIIFRTPACPIPPMDEDLEASIVIKQDNCVLTRIGFNYCIPAIRSCQNCRQVAVNINYANKRSFSLYNECHTDGGETLARELSRLSLAKTPSEPVHPNVTTKATSSDENESAFDKYLNRLKDAVAEFVRTENASRLFRRTRVLLSNCEDASPPLHDAIERGHVKLVQQLIEQAVDMPKTNGLLNQKNVLGETALLVAAKSNRSSILELILSKREDLAEEVDKEKNNFLHLLAKNQNEEMIQNSLTLLPATVKQRLLNGRNRANQRPVDVAESLANKTCMNMLKCSMTCE